MPKKKASAKKTEKIVAYAKIMGRMFSGEGETVREAIAAIEPGNVAGTVVLVVGDKERILSMQQGRRLFNMIGLPRETMLEQISEMFI